MPNVTILLVFGSIFLLGLAESYRSTAYPLITQLFNIDQKLSSLIFAITSFSSVITALSSLWWQKKFSSKNTNILAYFFFSLAYFSLYYSLQYKLFNLSLISSTLLGIGMGIIGINTNTSISRFIPKNKQLKYFSILHGLYGAASFVSPFIFNTLYPTFWSFGFLLIAILATLPILFSIFENSRPPIDREDNHNEITEVKRSWQTFYTVSTSLYVVSEILLSSRLTTFLTEIHSFPANKASIYLSYFFILLMSGRTFFAIYKIKTSPLKFAITANILTFIFFILGIYHNPIFLSFCGLTMAGIFPMLMTSAPTFFGKMAPKIISQTVILYGSLLFIMHFAFGIITDYSNSRSALLVGPICLGITICLLFFLIFSHKKIINQVK